MGFQERRLQYIEREQIKEWQSQRCGERILEVDVPLSYGILEASNCPNNINQCEFLWDPTHDVGIYIKINCISTEFTQKKHGGEKGVPFRILIETYCRDVPEKLHAATCQVKVFKPKGADRKHKTDREKMCKRSQADKDRYQPQFEYTVFRDLGFSDTWTSNHISIPYSPTTTSPTPSSPVSSGCSPSTPTDYILDSQKKEIYDGIQATSTTEPIESSEEHIPERVISVTHESSPAECILWLQRNMFDNLIKEFGNFTGADLLNLTRGDLIDICGAACGIRLYNNLHGKTYLTTYVRLPIHKAFSAIYLKTAKVLEFSSKIKAFCGLPADCKCDFYVSGPSGTRVILTDEVICNMLKDSLFVVECKENSSQSDDSFSVFLKRVTN